jgi:hypothetical protein
MEFVGGNRKVDGKTAEANLSANENSRARLRLKCQLNPGRRLKGMMITCPAGYTALQ